MALLERLQGTLEDLFQVGAAGVRFVISAAGIVETRDADGAALATHRAAHPTLAGLNDLVTQQAARGYTPHFVKGTSPLNRVMVPGLVGATALTTGAPALNRLIAIPFTVPWPCTLNRLLSNVTTAGTATNVRMGIYAATSLANIYPGSLLFDSGAIATTTTGVKAASSTLVLEQGRLYWACFVQGGTTAATFRALALAGARPALGLDVAMGTAPGVGLTVAFTFAALPASFPAGAAVLSAVPIPALGLELVLAKENGPEGPFISSDQRGG